MFKAGRARHRIRLQSPIRSQNDMGEPEVSWADLATCWAFISPKEPTARGNEFFANNQISSRVNTTFEIRYRPNIPNDARIVWRGKYYSIDTVMNPNEDRDSMLITAFEVGERSVL